MNAKTHGRWLASMAFGLAVPLAAHADQVEPTAGTWRTWAITSGSQYRVPPPPNAAETVSELDALNVSLSHNDAGIRSVIKYWDAGAPSYRWMEFINDRVNANLPTTAYSHRVHAYVAMAMHDATVATWDSKYAYNRKRPSEVDARLHAEIDVPQSPSYPSEHAATAQAAATVLAYFFPAEADAWQEMAEQAGWSRVLAGVNYPSDHDAGLALGRKVAEQVIAKAKTDGADIPWTGTVPTGCLQVAGHEPGERRGSNVDAAAAVAARRLPAAAAARLRVAAGASGDGSREDLRPHFRHELQGVLLPEPRRPGNVAAHLSRQMALRGRTGPQSAAHRACLRAGDGDAVRRVHRKPGRQVHVLVPAAEHARHVDRSTLPGAAVSKLSLEPLDVLDGAGGSARVSLPDRAATIRASPRRPAIRASGPASTSRWTTSQA